MAHVALAAVAVALAVAALASTLAARIAEHLAPRVAVCMAAQPDDEPPELSVDPAELAIAGALAELAAERRAAEHHPGPGLAACDAAAAEHSRLD